MDDLADAYLPQEDALAAATDILGDGKAWVELQDMLPHPTNELSADLAVVNAARVSFLGHSKGLDQDKKLLFYLLRNMHTSPFEQVEFKFRVRAPVVVWWQWVRHRTWHYNFQSGRYTPFSEEDIYIPKHWRQQSASNKQGSAGDFSSEESAAYTQQLIDLQDRAYKLYSEALEAGVAKEQARLFLPAWTSYYIAIVKVDSWNLMHFLRLRLDPHAQWEIRMFAEAMYDMFKQYMPWTAEAFSEYVFEMHTNAD